MLVVNIDDRCLNHSCCLSLLRLLFTPSDESVVTASLALLTPLDESECGSLRGCISSADWFVGVFLWPAELFLLSLSLLLVLLLDDLHMVSRCFEKSSGEMQIWCMVWYDVVGSFMGAW